MLQQATFMIAARIALALLFVVTGAQKVAAPARMAPLFQSMGLPATTGIAIGLFEVIAGLAFAIGFQVRWAGWALAVWCIVTAVMGHRFWAVDDPVQKGLQLSNFLKNVGLAGAFMAFGFLAAAPAAAA